MRFATIGVGLLSFALGCLAVVSETLVDATVRQWLLTGMLTLMGRYEPPLGALGRGVDRLVLHRIAEACIRSFLHRTAANLEQSTAA